jgi:hypothetical protein
MNGLVSYIRVLIDGDVDALSLLYYRTSGSARSSMPAYLSKSKPLEHHIHGLMIST